MPPQQGRFAGSSPDLICGVQKARQVELRVAGRKQEAIEFLRSPLFDLALPLCVSHLALLNGPTEGCCQALLWRSAVTTSASSLAGRNQQWHHVIKNSGGQTPNKSPPGEPWRALVREESPPKSIPLYDGWRAISCLMPPLPLHDDMPRLAG
jgi:hypothetical protein